MAQGLQVYDASSNLIMDIGTSIGRILGSTVTTASTSGSVTGVSGFSDGVGWYCVVPISANFTGISAPVVSISGTTISWTAVSTSVTIVYGVY